MSEGRTWTKEQEQAIKARDGTLLVSAAAGSGKTAVLVQRVIERITDPGNPCDVDRLLIVTFTRAAAAEMRERIGARLSELLLQNPADRYLQRQQLLLSQAHISTIHSFCADLARENFNRLGLSPDFKIAEESEVAVLSDQAMDEALEKRYEEGSEGFLRLVELLSPKRDDRPLCDMVRRLYEFVRSHPFPDRWMKEKLALYRPDGPVGRTPWGEIVVSYTVSALAHAERRLAYGLRLMQREPESEELYAPVFSAARECLCAVQALLESRDLDKVGQALRSFSFARRKPVKKGTVLTLGPQLDGVKKEVQDLVKRLCGLYEAGEAECREDLDALYPLVEALFDTVRLFSRHLDEKKAQKHMVDFGDLEHLAIRLLVKEEETGFVRTREAKELAARFEEVLVDEYQDTNEAQDLIFRAVSQEEGNLFFVGDVKQSIYRFRQAMPEIFLRRRNSLPGYQDGNYPAKITLGRNFRSREGVTDAVNFVFRQLMSEELGEMAYDEAEELRCGAVYPQSEEPDAELMVLDLSDLTKEDDRSAAQARAIGARIRELMDSGTTVFEHGRLRPMRYRDICILLRSKEGRAARYVQELSLLGIPAYTDVSGGFFGTVEISCMLSLLRVLDNPVQDVPLLSVMLSPLFGFTPDELADIRMASKGGALYHAVVAKAREDGKCREFLESLSRLRLSAAVLPAARLLNEIYEQTGYAAMVQAMPGGSQRKANLLLLTEYARKYESVGYGGLSGFLRFIDRLEQRKDDLAPAATLSGAADVVRIMSIHSSKGLEFPVCIVAGLGGQFNKSDVRAPALLHPQLGVGLKRRDALGRQFTTLPREAVALELERATLSEEMRVLYVAMTRAKERLILVTELKDPAATLQAVAANLPPSGRLESFFLRRAKGFFEWVLACALRHPDGGALRALAGREDIEPLPASSSWAMSVVTPPPLIGGEAGDAQLDLPVPDPALMDRIQTQIDWVYPFEAVNRIPAKVAASELAKSEQTGAFVAVSRPAFLSGGGLTPTEKGIALHSFMQFAEFDRAAEHPEEELSRLLLKGFLTKEQADSICMEKVRRFFKSGLYRRVKAARQVYREIRFHVGIPAGRFAGENVDVRGELVVLQGVADLVIEEENGLVVVDYKTDAARDGEQLLFRYANQLRLYAYAMEQVFHKPVKECAVYAFSLDHSFSLKEEKAKPGPL